MNGTTRPMEHDRSRGTRAFVEKEAKITSNGFGQHQWNGTTMNGEPKRQETKDVPDEVIERIKNFYDPEKMPEKFKEWSQDEQDDWMIANVKPVLKGYPESLWMLVPAITRSVNTDKYPPKKPDWLDMEKFQRGQRILRDNIFSTLSSVVMALTLMFSFKDGLKPILITGASSSPYNSFRRYLSSAMKIKTWTESDPWKKDSPAYNGIKVGRMYHEGTTNRISKLENKELDDITAMKNAWCPSRSILLEDFQKNIKEESILTRPYDILTDAPHRPKGINQAEMSIVQFTLMGLGLLYPRQMGFGVLKGEDMEAYCHFWRVVGYVFGIDDRYNFCNGTVAEIQQRGRDTIHYFVKQNLRTYTPEFEHLIRCTMEGIKFYFIEIPFETVILYVTKLFNVEVPKFRATVSYRSSFMFNVLWYYNMYLSKIPGVKSIMNNILIFAMNRASNFSKEKHEELKMRSKKILDTVTGST